MLDKTKLHKKKKVSRKLINVIVLEDQKEKKKKTIFCKTIFN